MIMASTSSSFVSTAHFIGQNVVTNGPRSPPNCVKFRPLRISAACTSTSERTRPHIKSPAASLYEVLGIQMGATCQEIKTAYRRLARVLHPDVASNSQRNNTTYEFIRIHEAYVTLSDPEKRADYDRMFFGQLQPVSFPFAMSASASASVSGSGYTRRTWETDQCW